jgi:phosphoribosylformylglycinamidine cyclo-ligase
MPSVYCEGEVDVVGCIVGTVGKQAVLPGDRVRDGDELIGLASWGLHTNGYSLARRVLVDFGPGIDGQLSGTGQRIGDALSANHRMYWAAARQFLERSELHAMAHITGGGIPGNLVRVLPAGMGARIDCGAWEVPAIFQEIQRHGGVDDEEMYRVFNMGIGWILVVAREVADEWRSKLTDEGWASVRLGRVERGVSGVQLARCVKG